MGNSNIEYRNPAAFFEKFKEDAFKKKSVGGMELTGLDWADPTAWWTDRVIAWFGNLGKIQGFTTCYSNGNNSEFLCDGCWYYGDPRGLNSRQQHWMEVAFEMEWDPEKQNFDDFIKLVVVKSYLKIFIWGGGPLKRMRPENVKTQIELMKNFVKNNEFKTDNEAYLLINLSPIPLTNTYGVQQKLKIEGFSINSYGKLDELGSKAS